MEAAMVMEALEPGHGQGKDKMKNPAMITPKSKAIMIRDTVKTNINTGADAEIEFSVLKSILSDMEVAMKYLDWKVVGLSAGTFLSFTYVLCIAYDLLFPEHAMYEAWYRLLPGFKWLTWGSFFLGLLESFLYGIYAGLVFAPLYNLFNMKLGRP